MEKPRDYSKVLRETVNKAVWAVLIEVTNGSYKYDTEAQIRGYLQTRLEEAEALVKSDEENV